MLRPDLYYRSVQDIDRADLKSRGVDTLLFDLDNTLLPRNCPDVTAELREYLAGLVDDGFDVGVVSNNWHAHVVEVGEQLGVPVFGKALKPLPGGFRRALAAFGSTPKRAAIVGDQLFTDVLGGGLLGMTTVLVTPLSASDLPHTVVLRYAERLVLAGRQPLP